MEINPVKLMHSEMGFCETWFALKIVAESIPSPLVMIKVFAKLSIPPWQRTFRNQKTPITRKHGSFYAATRDAFTSSKGNLPDFQTKPLQMHYREQNEATKDVKTRKQLLHIAGSLVCNCMIVAWS